MIKHLKSKNAGVSLWAQWVTLLLVTPASHRGALVGVSAALLLTQLPVNSAWEGSGKWPNCFGSYHLSGRADTVIGSWLWTGSAQAIIAI